MAIETKADFQNLRREDGTLSGTVALTIEGDFATQHFAETLDPKPFSIPPGGEQEVYRTQWTAGGITFTLAAAVHGRTAGQCCFQGALSLHATLGGGLDREVGPHCQPAP